VLVSVGRKPIRGVNDNGEGPQMDSEKKSREAKGTYTLVLKTKKRN